MDFLKKISALCLILAMLFSLGACKGKAPVETDKPLTIITDAETVSVITEAKTTAAETTGAATEAETVSPVTTAAETTAAETTKAETTKA